MMGARKKLDKRLEVLHKGELCLNLLLCCFQKTKEHKKIKQWAVSSKKYSENQQETKVAVAGFRAKNFYSPREILTNGANKVFSPREVLSRPARRKKIQAAIRAQRFCFTRYREKVCAKII